MVSHSVSMLAVVSMVIALSINFGVVFEAYLLHYLLAMCVAFACIEGAKCLDGFLNLQIIALQGRVSCGQQLDGLSRERREAENLKAGHLRGGEGTLGEGCNGR
ncbi:hypothetical protein Ancab_036271 [Ancistrocladus abbreviatus]